MYYRTEARFVPLQDRYGNWRVVLAQRVGGGWRVLDWRPRLAEAV